MAERVVKNAQLPGEPNKRRRDDLCVAAEDGEISALVSHVMWTYKLEPIDTSDPEQVRERIEAYFMHCVDADMKPTVSGMCNALGITRATFHNWCEGVYRQGSHLDIVKKAKGVLEELHESYMVNGKINPVTGIFLAKNNFGYRDQQEVVLKPTMDLGDQASPEDLQQKYLEAAGVVIDSTAE